MQLKEFLGSEPGLTMLGCALGAIWTFFRGQSWYQRARGRRYQKALTALEAGVEQTYDVYVRAIKEAREDGTLTDDERRRARRLARDAAEEFGETQGVDVVRELGEDYLDLWMTRIVNKLKPAA